jgi:hypothetical protein
MSLTPSITTSGICRITHNADLGGLGRSPDPAKPPQIPEDDLKILTAIYFKQIPECYRATGSLKRMIDNYRDEVVPKNYRRLLQLLK